jgi:hypothetical protein
MLAILNFKLPLSVAVEMVLLLKRIKPTPATPTPPLKKKAMESPCLIVGL